MMWPFNIFSASFSEDSIPAIPLQAEIDTTGIDYKAFPDSIWLDNIPVGSRTEIVGDSITQIGDSIAITPEGAVPVDTIPLPASDFEPYITKDQVEDPDYTIRNFTPDPQRAVWMSALCPGLGQLYNRRYWKLPIIVGGFMGLAYGYSWNNQMLTDYSQAYRDLLDNDPSTNSYMDFYPPNIDESSLDKSWLEKVFKSRKDYFRRNRDLCIIGMVGVYLVAMVDAYVDASLTHFDISPDLSVDLNPTLIPDARNSVPGVGLQWALSF